MSAFSVPIEKLVVFAERGRGVHPVSGGLLMRLLGLDLRVWVKVIYRNRKISGYLSVKPASEPNSTITFPVMVGGRSSQVCLIIVGIVGELFTNQTQLVPDKRDDWIKVQIECIQVLDSCLKPVSGPRQLKPIPDAVAGKCAELGFVVQTTQPRLVVLKVLDESLNLTFSLHQQPRFRTKPMPVVRRDLFGSG